MFFKEYRQAVNFFESFSNLPLKDNRLRVGEKSFYLKRFSYLLKLLKNPEKYFKFIHVGGTSGKGSTVAMIQSILTEVGYITGGYYSPYPTTSIERIKVNDLYISPKDLIRLTNYLIPYLEKTYLHCPEGPVSYFEASLALAFLYFKEKKCAYVVLEVGLGGAHDYTNIIEKSEITVITNINFDHTQILGKTLKEIALNKAGIIKKGGYFITTEKRKSILNIFERICIKKKNKFKFLKPSFEYIKTDKEKTVFKTQGKEYALSLLGPLQAENAFLAIEAAKRLKIKEEAIKRGLKKAKLSCRFEIIQKNPLVVLDGAHNPSKLKALAEIVKEIKYNKLHLVIGMSGNKDIKKSLKEIIFLADKIYLTRFTMPFRKTADFREIRRHIKKNAPIFLDPFKALKTVLDKTDENDLVLITGSFFLAGELRRKWIPEEFILKKRKSFL